MCLPDGIFGRWFLFPHRCYLPLTMEQWVAAVFQVPESLIQVSLQITDVQVTRDTR